MSNYSAALYQLYAVIATIVLVLATIIYMEFDGKKATTPSGTSTAKDVKHERDARDTTEYSGSGKAVQRHRSCKRRGRDTRSVVHSGGQSTMRSRQVQPSVYRRHGRGDDQWLRDLEVF